MNIPANPWLLDFAAAAEKSDRFTRDRDHIALLSAGLFGEAGSIIAELKKERRELNAYPAYRNRMLEELGDFLWYYVRLITVVRPELIAELCLTTSAPDLQTAGKQLPRFLHFGTIVGDAVRSVSGRGSDNGESAKRDLRRIWNLLKEISDAYRIPLSEAAESNERKTVSRWPLEKKYRAPFDGGCLEEEQLPRLLQIEFREQRRGTRTAVILRCNGLNFGDRVTDNMEDADGYRFHDIFHFANVVHLGWSPVIRSLLRCKRKSDPHLDENQDGARATIIEEAVAATVFSRGKKLNFFDGLDHVDFDLLKTVKEFVEGFEVADLPFWQWEQAILDGFRVFRLLREKKGGFITLSMDRRTLDFAQLPRS